MVQVSFIMICIIHKILVFLKITRIFLMMESPSLEEKNIIKDVRNLFRLKKEIDDTKIKDIRNLFRLKKEKKVIKGRIPRYIRNIFEHEEEEEENCHKSVRVSIFSSNNYIEYKSKIYIYKIYILFIEIKPFQLKNILIKLDHT